MTKVNPQKIKKILLVRPDAIGDVVLMLPAVATLRKRFPQSYIAVLAREYTHDLLRNHPDINQVIIDEIYGKKPFGIGNYLAFVKKIREQKFELIIHFYHELPYALLGILARIPYRLGDRAKVLLGGFSNLKATLPWNDLTRHEVEYDLELLKPLGINTPAPEIQIAINPEAARSIRQRLKEKGVYENDLVVGVHVGTSRSNNKPWGEENLAKVIDWLEAEKKARVILTGGAADQDRVARLLALTGQPPIDFTGKLTLAELVALTSRYSFYLGMDTGPTHLAAALKIPLVVIYLSKRAKPLRWGPWGTRHLVLRPVSKCQLACLPTRCDYPTCSEELTVDEVITAVDKVLAGGGVTNETEAFRHWLQKSLSIVVTGSRSQEIAELLQAANYRVNILPSTISIKKILDFLIAVDASVVHDTGTIPFPALYLAVLLTGSYLANRTLYIKDRGTDHKSAQEIIDFYVDHFRKTRL